MLEESRMDKKSLNRSSLQQSRTTAIDCKKSTELTHKPWPRNNKKREGSGNAPKNESNRKNIPPQRGRGQMDKRPRARGATNFVVGGTQNAGLENEEEPEIGSVFTPGSKKQNLNHLLNFMYPSRGGTDNRGVVPRRQVQRVSYRYEHDLYLRAYCQFVVKEDGDYKVNLMDPDLPLKWEKIEEIVVRSTGKSECPICLGTPVAGRVGHCGHVYCWACILHYSATHEKQPPPCPVCAMALQVSEMKPTRMVQWEPSAEEVTMRLVRRLRGSTILEVSPPHGQVNETTEPQTLPLKDLNKSPFARLFTASKQEVMDILERDRKQIEAQILAEIDTTEIVYLEQALDMLKLKEEQIQICYESPKNNNENIVTPLVPTVYEKQQINETKLDWFDVTDEGATCLEHIEDKMASLDVNVQSNLNPDAEAFQCDMNENIDVEFPLIENVPDDQHIDKNDFESMYKENQAKYFYFYQAEDGQQVFLNSLNVRILNASWGMLAAAPSFIRGRVLHRETQPLCEQTRKHMPHTAHLPLHCSFDIVELDLKPPFVTEEALYIFSAELEKRARLRAKNQRDERRRDRAHRRAMEGPPKPDFSSDLMFPPAAPIYYGSPPQAEFSLSYEQVSPSTSVDQVSPSTNVTSSSGLSFAKMAGAGGPWRVRKTAPPPPPPEEEVSGPRTLVLSDAIEAALQATSPQPTGKKKKTKQKVLFTTGMHRAA